MGMMRQMAAALLLAASWLVSGGACDASAVEVPPLTGRIVDEAHVLPPALLEQLSAELQAHELKTSNQVAVLIIPSLDGEPLFDLSHRVATSWQLGRKGTDNGVLLLVAIKDRKVRLEVGYGLEGVLTDARSAQIIRNEIVPRFRNGDIPGGVRAGVQAVLKTIEGTYQASERPAPPPTSEDAVNKALFAVILGVVIGLAFSRVHRVMGAVAGGGLSFLMAPWVVPALVAGAVSLALVSLFSAVGQGGGRGRGRTDPFDGTWFSTQHGGWGSGGLGGSLGGSDSFAGGGGSFGGGGASGDW